MQTNQKASNQPMFEPILTERVRILEEKIKGMEQWAALVNEQLKKVSGTPRILKYSEHFPEFDKLEINGTLKIPAHDEKEAQSVRAAIFNHAEKSGKDIRTMNLAGEIMIVRIK